MRRTKITKVLALTLVFLMVMTSTVFAVTVERKLSNELTAKFNVSKKTGIDVKNLQELKDALKGTYDQINIVASFDANEEILITRPVIIDGKGNTITYNGNITGWNGDYVIQVYNTSSVVIKNIKLTGGDAALLVNGSKVILTGNIDVSGNEYGGIESSQGVGVGLPSLDASDVTFINGSEKVGRPTIWEDKVTGTVTQSGLHVLHINGQVQYYIDSSNTIPVKLSGLTGEYNAEEGDVKEINITSKLAEFVTSIQEKLLLEIKVSKDGIKASDFNFDSEFGTALMDENKDYIAYYINVKELSEVNNEANTQIKLIFNTAGKYDVAVSVVQSSDADLIANSPLSHLAGWPSLKESGYDERGLSVSYDFMFKEWEIKDLTSVKVSIFKDNKLVATNELKDPTSFSRKDLTGSFYTGAITETTSWNVEQINGNLRDIVFDKMQLTVAKDGQTYVFTSVDIRD